MIAELEKLEREIRDVERACRYGDGLIEGHLAVKWANRLAAIRSEGVTEAMIARALDRYYGKGEWEDDDAAVEDMRAALTAALTDKGETP